MDPNKSRQEALLTVLLPVYGRATYLENAVSSVLGQGDREWRLLLADDGSDLVTLSELESWTAKDERIKLKRRSRNLGLFANLNAALEEIKTPWLLLLCSDDCLELDALEKLSNLIECYPECDLVLSSYRSIDEVGAERCDVNGFFYDHFAPSTAVVPQGELLAPLLRFGSVNGNITGMLIRRELFVRTGPWRSDWSQSADWEWLVRATQATPILINRDPIARVRVHGAQLSVRNRQLQRETEESLFVLRELQRLLPGHRRWAAHHAQFLLWNACKAAPRVGLQATLRQFGLIHKHVGLLATVLAFLRTVPARWRIRGSDQPLPPPPA